MADRIIQIIIDVADKTGGKLDGLKKSLLAIDAAAQKTHAKLAALAHSSYNASVRLIDRVTQPGSRLNAFLLSLANKTYTITTRLNDSALNKLRQLEAGLMKVAGKAWTIAVNLKDNISQKVRGLSDGLLMGAGMLGTAGIGYGVANAAQSYMAFEKQMSAVQAVRQLQKDSPEMIALVEQARLLGEKTAWTSQQVGQAQYYQALAGWDTNRILQTTPHLLNLASAGNVDLKAASDIVTDAMTAFGISPEEFFTDKQGRYVNAAQHFIDMFAKLQAVSNTDILQAGEAFKYGAANVGVMYHGKDIQTRMQAVEDAFMMVGLEANAGFKGSMAGTGLKEVWNRIGSMNQNAQRMLEMMGVEYKDEHGDFLLQSQILGKLRQRITQGIDPALLTDYLVEMGGQKINAQTRRKLESFIEQTVKNGGKVGSADVIKAMSAIGGSEHSGKLAAILLGDQAQMLEKLDNVHGTAAEMAATQLDNLAGSLTLLGSAWDGFQRSFFEGDAGSGLRAFVDSVTELVSRANRLFADGIDLGDLTKLGLDALERLKNKFLELDGIGSILAGGALMGAFVKLGLVIQKALGYVGKLKGLEIGSRAGASAGTKAGVVNVSGNVVNVNGRTNAVRGQSIIDNYTRTKERVRGGGTPPPAPPISSSWRSGALGSAAFAALFAALDLYNAKALSSERVGAIDQEISAQRAQYHQLLESSAPPGALSEQLKLLQSLEVERLQILNENATHERETLAGGSGAVLGSALGAALGSMAGPFGTAVGAVIGGVIGEYLGIKAADAASQTPSADAFHQTQTVHEKIADTAAERTVKRFQIIDDKIQQWSGRRLFDSPPPPPDFQLLARQVRTPQPDDMYQLDNALTIMREGGFEHLLDKTLDNAAAAFSPSFLLDDFFTTRAHAATPDDFTTAENFTTPDLSFSENLASELESASETIASFNTMITEGMREAFEGAGEEISSFGERMSEGLVSAFEGASEAISSFSELVMEGFSEAFERAGEVMTGFGEELSNGLAGAQSAAEAALLSIGEEFEGAKSKIVGSWSEVPGVFIGIFSGLGGAAAAAGAAIYSGLTSVIGAVIGDWQSAAATISGIVSSISAMSSQVASMTPSIGTSSVPAFAEGGFVTEPTYLAGEAGGEVVIPLSSSKRARALDLFQKTAAILGGVAAPPQNDSLTQGASFAHDFYPSSPPSSPTSPLTTYQLTTSHFPTSLQIDNINLSFEINGAEDSSDIMEQIKAHINELADNIGARLARTIDTSFGNMALS